MMSNKVSYIKIDQPIGTMFLTKLPAKIVSEISATFNRKPYNDNVSRYEGIQRRLEPARVKSIAEFCKRDDAMFPTPIILSAPSNSFIINEEDQTITISEDGIYCSIIDGQHRIEGIKESGYIDKFELLIEFVFDTDPARDAYLFSIINGNQKPMSKSLIYDLFAVTKARTVEKLCNKIMRELNSNIKSKMIGKIKMLGYKDEFSPNGVVSQARLVDELKKLISDNTSRDNYDIEVGNELKELNAEKYIFREWFVYRDDEKIIDENIKFFNAWLTAIEKYSKPVNIKKTILEKSLGLSCAYRLLMILYSESVEYENAIYRIIEKFYLKGLDNKSFSSSESGIVDLLYTLIKLGHEEGVITKSKLEIFFRENQLNKIMTMNL